METFAHRTVKEIIKQEGMFLPPYRITMRGNHCSHVSKVYYGYHVKFDEVFLEKPDNGIRPDITAYKDNEKFYIEVAITNKIDEAKRKKLILRGASVIEINTVSWTESSIEHLRRHVLEGSICNKWICSQKDWMFKSIINQELDHIVKEKDAAFARFSSKFSNRHALWFLPFIKRLMGAEYTGSRLNLFDLAKHFRLHINEVKSIVSAMAKYNLLCNMFILYAHNPADVHEEQISTYSKYPAKMYDYDKKDNSSSLYIKKPINLLSLKPTDSLFLCEDWMSILNKIDEELFCFQLPYISESKRNEHLKKLDDAEQKWMKRRDKELDEWSDRFCSRYY